MAYVIGILLAIAVYALARLVGFDRGRSFYPTVMIVVASYYALFAIMAGSVRALVFESAIFTAFVLLSVLGFKSTLWFVVAGLFAHGLFDLIHGHLLSNPGLPPWWPMFCMTYDVTAAIGLAWLLRKPGSAPTT